MSYGSRLTARAGDWISRQVVRLAGLRPSPTPVSALREGVNVLLARTEEINCSSRRQEALTSCK